MREFISKFFTRRFKNRVKAEVRHVRRALTVVRHLDDYSYTKRCTYNDDGLMTEHNSDFLKDPRFVEAYRLAKATGSWPGFDLEWRTYVVCWAANKAKALPGDFVECGVNLGGFSRAAMHYIDFQQLPDKKFYLLDTYSGFPEEFKNVAVQLHMSHYEDCYEQVVDNFKQFDNAILVRGAVPHTLSQVPSEQVCYLSIDMNCAEPEIQAAEFFWDKLVSGAVVVLDDYAFGEEYRRQTTAFDEFAARKQVQVLALPTGQGLIFKP